MVNRHTPGQLSPRRTDPPPVQAFRAFPLLKPGICLERGGSLGHAWQDSRVGSALAVGAGVGAAAETLPRVAAYAVAA